MNEQLDKAIKTLTTAERPADVIFSGTLIKDEVTKLDAKIKALEDEISKHEEETKRNAKALYDMSQLVAIQPKEKTDDTEKDNEEKALSIKELVFGKGK